MVKKNECENQFLFISLGPYSFNKRKTIMQETNNAYRIMNIYILGQKGSKNCGEFRI